MLGKGRCDRIASAQARFHAICYKLLESLVSICIKCEIVHCLPALPNQVLAMALSAAKARIKTEESENFIIGIYRFMSPNLG